MSRLIVIAGPPCSGKTTLARGLGATAATFIAEQLVPRQLAVWQHAETDNSEFVRRLPPASVIPLAEHLGIGNSSGWRCLEAMDLALLQRQGTSTNPSLPEYLVRKVHRRGLDRLILHYGMLAPWRYLGVSQGYDKDERLALLDCFDEITLVTLWVAPELLRGRLKRKIGLLCKSIVSRPRSGLQRLRTVLRFIQVWHLCANAPELLQQYDRWFEFCDSCKAEAHWIVDNSGVPELFPRSSWSRMRGRVMDSLASGT